MKRPGSHLGKDATGARKRANLRKTDSIFLFRNNYLGGLRNLSEVYARSLALLAKLTEALDVSFDDIARSAGIDPKLIKTIDATIPAENYFRLLDEIVSRTGNPDFGLLSGRISYIEGFHLYMYLASISRSLREWLNVIPTSSSFLGTLVTVQVRRTADHLILEMHFSSPPNPVRCAVTDSLLLSTALLMDGFGVLPVRPVRVDFSYPQPKSIKALTDAFRAPLFFNQRVSALHYETRVLDIPQVHVSTDVYDNVKSELDFFLHDHSWDAGPFTVSLYAEVRRQLPSGDCSINSVAKQLAISSRTLQRRLKERGTTFQQFLQDVKSSLAVMYLEDDSLTIIDISRLLGYSDQNSFSAAFKSWHGKAPSEFRRN